MGTGIVSILLHNLPYNAQWLQYISYLIFALNVVLFVTFLVISILRYALFPEIWSAMLEHPGQSLFLGCFPMGFASKPHHQTPNLNPQTATVPLTKTKKNKTQPSST